MRDDRERLLDILEAIEKIDKYAAQGRQAFDFHELIQSWIANHLRILRVLDLNLIAAPGDGLVSRRILYWTSGTFRYILGLYGSQTFSPSP